MYIIFVFISIWLKIKNINKYGNNDLKNIISILEVEDMLVDKLVIINIKEIDINIYKLNFKYFIVSPIYFINYGYKKCYNSKD